MTGINRRSLLQTLAASTALVSAVTGEGAQAETRIEKRLSHGDDNRRRGAWFMARQNCNTSEQHTVDFWSKPLVEIRHADHLPSGIARGALWHEFDAPTSHHGNPVPQECNALDYTDSVLKQDRSDWINDPLQFNGHCDNTKSLSSLLGSLVGNKAMKRSGKRTALLALDSQSPSPMDPGWADILPAFRDCYDRVIGHFHLESRGFRHWKMCLTQFPFDCADFNRFFSQPASQCDAVVFTSPSLVELDYMHAPEASTETLVGQLMKRLGRVLLDENTLEQFLPVREDGLRSKTRAFALSTITPFVSRPVIDWRDLDRQNALVSGSFGDQNHMRPLAISTGDYEIEFSDQLICDHLHMTHFGYLRTWNSYQLRTGDPGESPALIMLWPFDAEIGQPSDT